MFMCMRACVFLHVCVSVSTCGGVLFFTCLLCLVLSVLFFVSVLLLLLC